MFALPENSPKRDRRSKFNRRLGWKYLICSWISYKQSADLQIFKPSQNEYFDNQTDMTPQHCFTKLQQKFSSFWKVETNQTLIDLYSNVENWRNELPATSSRSQIWTTFNIWCKKNIIYLPWSQNLIVKKTEHVLPIQCIRTINLWLVHC